jgi:hypothetical protein
MELEGRREKAMRTWIPLVAVILVLVALVGIPASALMYDETEGNFTASTTGAGLVNLPYWTTDYPSLRNGSFLRFSDIGFFKEAPFQIVQYHSLTGGSSGTTMVRSSELATVNSSSEPVTFRDFSGGVKGSVLGTGTISYQIDLHNAVQIITTISSWSIGTRSGRYPVILDYNYSRFYLGSYATSAGNLSVEDLVYLTYAYNVDYGIPATAGTGSWGNSYGVIIYYSQNWKNHFRFNNDSTFTQIWVDRVYDTGSYPSTISIDGDAPGVGHRDFVKDSYGTGQFYIGDIPDETANLHLSILDIYGDYHDAYWNVGGTSNSCKVYAKVRNQINGNLIGPATFRFWTAGGSPTVYSFSGGTGIVNATKDVTYYWNATVPGYVNSGTNSGVLYDDTTGCDYGGTTGGTIYSNLVPSAGTVSNTTVSIGALEGHLCEALPAGECGFIVQGAAINILGGWGTKVTGEYGNAIWTNLPTNGTFVYRITKTGYDKFEGNFTISGEAYKSIWTPIYSQLQTAITPTVSGTIDTRSREQKAEAAKNVWYDNIEGISALLFLAVMVGILDKIGGRRGKRK